MPEQPDKKIACPECGNSLKEVYAGANYGRVLLLDQCERCGGIWFDCWELYHLKDAEAKRLDTIGINSLLAAPPSQQGSGLCPKCNTVSLEHFKDPNLPADSKINRCPKCNGLWLNRGELTKYDENKGKRRSRLEEAEGSEGVKNAIAVDRQMAKWETISRLAAVLKARPEQDANIVYAEDRKQESAALTKDAVFLILQILFRIIFKI
ncbi:MAG: zf-TFIIB domain-containing protein [Deltaproteobacteria bacterium]|nr:zf-TFIIB domain-containing protein [Deltaproteobacteria bacterium]MBI3754984.1 zf-TFIIB domain-containing protein [Deltaproteobacteria bacterium]